MASRTEQRTRDGIKVGQVTFVTDTKKVGAGRRLTEQLEYLHVFLGARNILEKNGSIYR